ncbi:hypothetical protein BN938_0946 [Mucinivorans hirudinis]|uniref:Uncharacterized protein n=1 Tax=Mucinivorans hirudinis TaxID=1433126 RepID=A0A060R789_9BACT|nr:hypothetical protein BN938_0946 [Mucinivorans hirudinis]
MDIRINFSVATAKKILANKVTAQKYLEELNKVKQVDGLYNNRGRIVCESRLVWDLVVRNWDYSTSKDIIRNIFSSSEKYQRGSEANCFVILLYNQ